MDIAQPAGWQSLALYNVSTIPKTLVNFSDLFEVLQVLGKGAFGQVLLIRDKSTGNLFALKVLSGRPLETLRREIGTLSQISRYPQCSPYTACYYDAFILPPGIPGVSDGSVIPNSAEKELFPGLFPGRETPSNVIYGVVMEYIPGTDLQKVLRERQLTQGEIFSLAKWLLSVIAILHAGGYVHRDIKPANIMVLPDGRLKLIDFGISCFVDLSYQKDKYECTETRAGTPGYFAPELMTDLYKKDLTKYYKSADVFSIGTLIYYLFTRRYPYPFEDSKMITGDYTPINIENGCLNYLLPRLLDLNPDTRPTAEKASEYLNSCQESHTSENIMVS